MDHAVALAVPLLAAALLVACQAPPRDNGGHPPIDASTAPEQPDAVPQLPDALTAHGWKLTHIAGQPVVGGDAKRAPALTFLPEGRVTGSTGVNRLNAEVGVREDRLRFGRVICTRMAGPPELNAQENELLKQLLLTTGYTIHEGTLTLYAGDAPALVAVPDAPAP